LPGEAKALIAVCIWAVTAIILTGLTRRIGTLPLNATRAAFGALFLLALIPFSGAAGDLAGMSAKTAVSMLGSGIVAFAIGDTFYFLALRNLPATIAVPISETAYPMFTFVLAWVWLGETFSGGLLIGSALVVIGIVLLTSQRGAPATSEVSGSVVPEEEADPALAPRHARVGLIAVFCAPVFWAISTVWLKAGSGNLGSGAASVMRIAPVALILLAATYSAPSALRRGRFRLVDFIGAAIVGLFGMGIASLLYVSAIQDVGASRTAILTATVPLFTLPLAIVFLKERVTPVLLLGTLVCIVGIWVIIYT
jgi:drug/metabolite transporter (DMT)-like permease